MVLGEIFKNSKGRSTRLKTAKWMLVVAVIIAGFFFTINNFFEYFETNSYNLENFDELVAKKLIKKGWVREGVPSDITDIFIQTDVDTNEIWFSGSAPFNSIDKVMLIYGFKKENTLNFNPRIRPFSKFNSFPTRKILRDSDSFKHYKNKGNYISVDEKNKRFILYLEGS